MPEIFAHRLETLIDAEYQRRGYRLGWRFLASPACVLHGARVSFISLNPAGKHDRKDHPRFSPAKGSAYVNEVWDRGKAAGQSKLQVQVRALFSEIGEDPEAVLAGHLVPFRSPSWSELEGRDHAVRLGTTIWKEILDRAQPHVVIAMGGPSIQVVSELILAREIDSFPLDWGDISAKRGWFPRQDGSRGGFIGLPHLSRFSIFERPEQRGRAEVRRLLDGLDRIGKV